MRPGQQNKRSRGRNSGRKHSNPLARNFESNGPDVKIRGNAAHIAEKYVQLARDAQASGDNVMSENYLQHAEHYFRILSAAQAQANPQQPRMDQQPSSGDDDEDYEGEADTAQRSQPQSETAEAGQQPEAASAEQPEKPARARRSSKAGKTEKTEKAETSDAPAKADSASDEGQAGEGEGEEKPKRTRRTRRKPRSEGEGDLAGSPQPELPAFLTSGTQNAAE